METATSLKNRDTSVIIEFRALFIVLANLPGFEQRLAQVFPGDFLPLPTGGWLLAAPGTSRDIYHRLGATEGMEGFVFVFRTSAHYGWAPESIWEWIAAKVGNQPRG